MLAVFLVAVFCLLLDALPYFDGGRRKDNH